MNYTKTPPTKPGDYRWRESAESKGYRLTVVYEADGTLYPSHGPHAYRPVSTLGGEWCGPLVPAEEAEAGAAVMREALEYVHKWSNGTTEAGIAKGDRMIQVALATGAGREFLAAHQEAVAHREFLREELAKAKTDLSRLAFRLSPEKEAELRAELKQMKEFRADTRDGSWIDKFASCRVCGGEIPHGHLRTCDIFKMEREIASLRRKVEASDVRRLLSEVEDLREWKQSAIAVEQGWDAQAVGRLLGLPIGSDIKSQIQPRVEVLLAEVERLRDANRYLVGGWSRVRDFIIGGCGPEEMFRFNDALKKENSKCVETQQAYIYSLWAELTSLRRKVAQADEMAREINTLNECVKEWGLSGQTLHHSFAQAKLEIDSLRRKVAAAEGMTEAADRFLSNYNRDGKPCSCGKCAACGLYAALAAWQEANK